MTDKIHTENLNGWNDAVAKVLQLLQTDPPSRVGEAVFTQKIRNLRKEDNEQHRTV